MTHLPADDVCLDESPDVVSERLADLEHGSQVVPPWTYGSTTLLPKPGNLIEVPADGIEGCD